MDIRQKPRHFGTARANLEASLGTIDKLTLLSANPSKQSLGCCR